MAKPRVTIELSDKQLDLLWELARYTSLTEIIEPAKVEMDKKMKEYNKKKRRPKNPDCSGGTTCPCICHDTGGADYGAHGPNGGRCKGTAGEF